jgi:hypothetical protein
MTHTFLRTSFLGMMLVAGGNPPAPQSFGNSLQRFVSWLRIIVKLSVLTVPSMIRLGHDPNSRESGGRVFLACRGRFPTRR